MSQLLARSVGATAKLIMFALFLVQLGGCSVFKTEDEVADEARVVINGTVTDATKLIISTKFERWYDEEGQVHTTILRSQEINLAEHMAGGATFDEIYPVKPDIGFLVRVVHMDDTPATISIQVYFDGELSYDQQDVSLTQSSLEFSYIFTNVNTLY